MQTKHPDARLETGWRAQLAETELAVLLADSAVAGRRVDAAPGTAEGLLADLWSRLHLADPDVAQAAFSDALQRGAPLDVIVDLAEHLTFLESIRTKDCT